MSSSDCDSESESEWHSEEDCEWDPVISSKFSEEMRQTYPGQKFELPGSKGAVTDLRGEKITPEPAFVVKTRALESNHKIFINFCKSPRIKTFSREPQAPTPEDPDPLERIRIPLSLGNAELELDKNGETCTVYDVVMNPEVIGTCTGNSDLRSWVVDVAMGSIENKSGGGLDRSFTTPRIRNNYKGSAIREQYIPSSDSILIEEVSETCSLGGGGNAPAISLSKISGASAASNYGKNSYGELAERQQHLVELNLTGNVDASHLSYPLSKLVLLQKLRIYSGPTWSSIADSIVNLRSLSLYLSGEGLESVAYPLGKLTALLELFFTGFGECSNNEISVTSQRAAGLRIAVSLAESLGELKSLRNLGLDWLKFGPEGIRHLSQPIGQLTALQRLSLRGNYFKSSGAEYFATSLGKLTALQELDLSRNSLRFQGARHLSTSLGNLIDLRILNIASNNLCSEACCFLLPYLLKMTQLLMYHNELDRSLFSYVTPCEVSFGGIGDYIINNPKLGVSFGRCMNSIHWQKYGLPKIPDEAANRFRSSGVWLPVLRYLRVFGILHPVHELRLMIIGDSEAGKTSLKNAFHSAELKTPPSAENFSTVGVEISRLEFLSTNGNPTIVCQVCDFAGQEIYYLSHTLHLKRRCLYLLLWTTQKCGRELTEDEIVGPLKSWLQLLSVNVPEATVFIVGTRCDERPERFTEMRSKVDRRLTEEIQRLHRIADKEAAETRRVATTLSEKMETFLRIFQNEAKSCTFNGKSFSHFWHSRTSRRSRFLNDLAQNRITASRSLRCKAQTILEMQQQLGGVHQRLSRLHGVYDGSLPSDHVPVAHLNLVRSKSFPVDSIKGVGVRELMAEIEKTCRNPRLMPFLGEQVPLAWLQVSHALLQVKFSSALTNCVLSLEDAASKVHSALQLPLQIEVGLARLLNIQHLQECLEFLALLGKVFVYKGFFLLDPSFVIDLMKPLVTHDLRDHQFNLAYCRPSSPVDPSHLIQLRDRAILDHRILSSLNSWPSSPQAINSLLSFFKDSFIISNFDYGYIFHYECSLVTARLCDSSDDQRQLAVQQKAEEIEAESQFYAVYVVPYEHIGFMAQMQVMVEKMRPSRIHLSVTCGKNNISMERGFSREQREQEQQSGEGNRDEKERVKATSVARVRCGSRLHRCCVSLRSMDAVLHSTLGSLAAKISQTVYSHALIICSNNDGLFAFAARCVDKIMSSCAFGSTYQSWLACRPLLLPKEARSWIPIEDDWAQLGTDENQKCLSEILSANANDMVLNSHNHQRRLKDLFPQKPPVFISHTCNIDQDETHGFCQRLHDELQKKLLCTVWFDKTEQDCREFTQELQMSLCNASFFVICLTPLYLTLPNCMRELRWALKMCESDSSKKIVVLPLHPAVSLRGCKQIIEASRVDLPAHVFLPVDDRVKEEPRELEQLKGHKLTDRSVDIIKMLIETAILGIDAKWLKLMPWLSDEVKDIKDLLYHVTDNFAYMDKLLDDMLPAIFLSIANSSPFTDSISSNFDDSVEQLASIPPSQDYRVPGNVAIIRDCFERSQEIFTERELATLVHYGLSDADIMECVVHHRHANRGAAEAQYARGYSSPEEDEEEEASGSLEQRGGQHRGGLEESFHFAARISGVDFEAANKKWLTLKHVLTYNSHDTVLKQDKEHSNMCKAQKMIEIAAPGVIDVISTEFQSFHSESLSRVMSVKPHCADETLWKLSPEALAAWHILLLQHHRNQNLKDIERFFENVPRADLLWCPIAGPHQIAKVYCSQGASHQDYICQLDAAKLFNILHQCTRFPQNVQTHAIHCNCSRNNLSHVEQSSLKLSEAKYEAAYKNLCNLLETLKENAKCLDALTQLKALHPERWQMLNVEPVKRMQDEICLLRSQLADSQGFKNSFSLKVLDLLRVYPHFSKPERFECKVLVERGPVKIGDDVGKTIVSAGNLFVPGIGPSASFVSSLSIAQEGKKRVQKIATSGQEVIVEITVVSSDTFKFPSEEFKADRYKELLEKIRLVVRGLVAPPAHVERLQGILKKVEIEPPKKLSNDDVLFCCKTCLLSDEESKLLPSNAPKSGGKMDGRGGEGGIVPLENP